MIIFLFYLINIIKLVKIDKLSDEQKEWALIKQNILKMTAQKNVNLVYFFFFFIFNLFVFIE